LKGFIKINIEPGTEKSVYDSLMMINGIRDVVPVYCENDFMAIAEVASISDLNKAVLAVHEIDGVTCTRTILSPIISGYGAEVLSRHFEA
jgi:hypothetical protein